MKTHLISIPKPCHEDWGAMIPNEQGRFCGQCARTVTDFTGMKALEIQSYLLENSSKKVCGRFKADQLDKVTISIPERVLFTQTRFRNIFLLALLVSMGTTLFSCNNGQTIGEVAIQKDSITNSTDIVPPAPLKSKVSCDTHGPEELTGEVAVGPVATKEIHLTGAVAIDPVPPEIVGDIDMSPLPDPVPTKTSRKQDNEIHLTGLTKIDTIP